MLKYYDQQGVTLVAFLFGVILANAARFLGLPQWLLVLTLLWGIFYYAGKANEAEDAQTEDTK